MTTPAFEAYLAKLYVDDLERAKFLEQPIAAARAAGLNHDECEALDGIDLVGLQLAAVSFGKKRASKRKSWWRRLLPRRR
jgi:hypothetical protein